MDTLKRYRESLRSDSHAKERYEKKLKLVGLQECPYAISADLWMDDVTKWPAVEFPDIVMYLIDTPGEYTRENQGLQEPRGLQLFHQWLGRYLLCARG